MRSQQSGPRRGGVVDAARIGRQKPAAMRDDELQVGIIGEHAAKDQMMQSHRRIERVADHVVEVMVGEAPRFGKPVGMHEDDEAQLLAAREDLAKALGRQIVAGDMGHDLDAAEAQRFVQSVEFGERQLGGLERHGAETDEAVRVAAADIRNEIVDGARRLEPEIGVGAVIGLARRRRDRLDVDPHPVHVLDPLLGRSALGAGPHAVLPIDLAAALRWPKFRETTARRRNCLRPSPPPSRSGHGSGCRS